MNSSEEMMFKENLKEWIYSEKKLVNYLYLSLSVGVHVNLAKQMLFQFYNEEIKNNKNLQAIYYVSGWNKEMNIFTSTICWDTNLEKIKESFHRLASVHVYALSAKESIDTLKSVSSSEGLILKQLTENMKELTLITKEKDFSLGSFGPFVEIKPLFNSKEDVQNKKQHEQCNTSANGINPKQTHKSPAKLHNTTSSTKIVASVPNNGKKGNRLESMFAAAAAKPPQPKKECSDSKKENVKVQTKTKKQIDEVPRKRRRIRDILSSDEDEIEEEYENFGKKRNAIVSSDEEREIEEKRTSRNGKLRRTIQMLVDSESSEDETPSSKRVAVSLKRKEKEISPENSIRSFAEIGQSSQQRRRTKVVTTQVMDDEGYLVTKREKVSASESEEEISAPKSEKIVNSSTQKVLSSSSTHSSNSTNTKSKIKSVPKTKQATLTSFFVKKPN